MSRFYQALAGSLILLVYLAPLLNAEDLSGPNSVVPAFRYSSVSGDAEKFREDWWIRDGPAGGFDELKFERKFENDFSLSLDGRAMIAEDDYLFRLKTAKEGKGYFLAEYTEFRKYFDGTGGFYRPFGVPPFETGRDLRLNIGSVLLEAGLSQADLPKVAGRYQRKFKEGDKSLLGWGRVTQAGTAKNIFPTFKDIDEKTDIFGLKIEHRIGKVHVSDNFHYERYRTDTSRFSEERNLTSGDRKNVTVNESYSHDAFYNAFRAEGFPREKLYFSLGHLYSRLSGEGGLRIDTVPFGPQPFDNNWFTRSVRVRHDSHVLNLNGKLGPFKDFVAYGGIKAETTDSEGDTDAVLLRTVPGPAPASPEALISTSRDKSALEETLGVRFTGLPKTTIYAEGRWNQNEIDLFERQLEDGTPGFERLTESDGSGQRYTLGLNTSPFPTTTFSLRYRRSYTRNNYDHVVDSEPGYSAFITSQDLKKDELSARLSFRPFSRTHMSLMYKHLSLDIDTAHDTTPPGPIRSGNYDANIYSARLAVRPAARVNLSGLFSYQNVKSTAFANLSPSVVTYEGDVFSTLLTAGYSIDEQTTLTMEYLFTRADNVQENILDGLPLGIDNRRHALLLGLSRQISDTAQARFQHGYYRYDDKGNGGADDYRANVFLLSVAYSF